MLLGMPIPDIRIHGQVSEVRAGVRSAWRAARESRWIHALRNAKRFLRNRWRAFCFTRRFYSQACRAEGALFPAESNVCRQDLTESLIQRSLPQALHALIQLRVASQIASVTEIAARTETCHRNGWSEVQVRAAMVGNPGEAFSEPEVLALRYADEITRTPIDVDPQTLQQLRRYFSQPDLAELTASIAHENFRCRFADANSKIRSREPKQFSAA
jgi:hypothetical protein